MTTPKLSASQAFAKLSLLGFLVMVLFSPALTPHRGLQAASKPKGKPYALIVGTVWGPDDHPVYGITVRIRRGKDKPNKVRWELHSDHMGEFAQRVPTGESDYIISADLKGVKTVDGKPLHLVKEVTVHIYFDERADTGLHLTAE